MKTKSEEVFESFLTLNNIPFKKIEEIKEKASYRPDYLLHIGDLKLVVEVKELDKDENFGVVEDPSGLELRSNHRILGEHVRNKIRASKKQIKYGANQGIPSILLIYNNIDRVFQEFGTDDLDFKTAMYGKLTILINKNTRERSELFQGKKNELQESKNTSFSAVGRLADRGGRPTVTMFENVYSKVKIPYEILPPCFEVKRCEVSNAPLSFA